LSRKVVGVIAQQRSDGAYLPDVQPVMHHHPLHELENCLISEATALRVGGDASGLGDGEVEKVRLCILLNAFQGRLHFIEGGAGWSSAEAEIISKPLIGWLMLT